jgi:competence protein ComEA
MKSLLLVLLFLFAGNVFAAVDINTATIEQLETVKGIGPAKAAAIIAERQKGLFKSVADLKRVKGFGDKTIKKLESELTVGGSAASPATPSTTKSVVPTAAPPAASKPAPKAAPPAAPK